MTNEKKDNIFNSPVKAVNIGVRLLGEALESQGIDTVFLDWRPPKQVTLSPRIREILKQIDEE